MTYISSRAALAAGLAFVLAACGQPGDGPAPAEESAAPVAAGTAAPETLAPETGAASQTPEPLGYLPDKWAACDNEGTADGRLNSAAITVLKAHDGLSPPEDCLTPIHLIETPEIGYLITMTGLPGEGCHGCSALLSVHYLKPEGPGFSYINSFTEVTSTGTWNNPGSITDVSIDGAPAIVIEHGGVFQGYGYGLATFVRMGPAGPREIVQKPVMCTSSSNGGAVEDDSADYYHLTADWRLDDGGRKLIADTVVSEKGTERKERLEWTLKGDAFELTSGNYPEPLGGEFCV